MDTTVESITTLEQMRWLWDVLSKWRYLIQIERTPESIGFGTTDKIVAGVDILQTTDDTLSTLRTFPMSAVSPTGSAEFPISATVRYPTLPGVDPIFAFSFSLGFPGLQLMRGEKMREAEEKMRESVGAPREQSFLKTMPLEEFAKQSIVLDVRTHVLNVDPLGFLLSKCAQVNGDLIKASTFDEAFPALTALGEHYRSLLLSDLDAILTEEGKRSKGELEIFGAKIPSEVVVVVGVPLLVLLLLQFGSVCAYIVKSVTLLDSDQASQWSLLLNGSGFIIFGYVTCAFLPVLAVVLSVLYVTSSTWYRWPVFGSLAIAAIAFGGTSAFNFHRLRRLVR